MEGMLGPDTNESRLEYSPAASILQALDVGASNTTKGFFIAPVSKQHLLDKSEQCQSGS